EYRTEQRRALDPEVHDEKKDGQRADRLDVARRGPADPRARREAAEREKDPDREGQRDRRDGQLDGGEDALAEEPDDVRLDEEGPGAAAHPRHGADRRAEGLEQIAHRAIRSLRSSQLTPRLAGIVKNR